MSHPLSFGDNSIRENEERLREAAAMGDLENLNSLLKTGVDINAQNIINHWTALHWACKRGHKEIIFSLLKHGADPTLETVNEETCWQLLANPEMAEEFAQTFDIKRETFENDILKKEPETETDLKSDTMSFIPNYLANPPFPYLKEKILDPIVPVNNYERASENLSSINNFNWSNSNRNPTITQSIKKKREDKIIKIRLEGGQDFYEIDLPFENWTYAGLLSVACQEWDIAAEKIKKVRKLPNTILRKDREVLRLDNYQELELVLK